MSIDYKREEEIRAFRRYARLGLHKESDPISVINRIRKNSSEEVARDLLAVWDTLRLLEAMGKSDAAQAVRSVYFLASEMQFHAKDITYLIINVSRELHCDDRTVYRRLREARELWRRLREYKQK
jgi:hypothetical protein